MIGRAKARVFPVPVLALANRSLFSSKIVLNVAAWMGNKTFTPRACKACRVTDEREKSPSLRTLGSRREGLLRRLVLGVDGPRARPRVRLHARIKGILGLGLFFLFGASSSSPPCVFSFFFFFFSGTGSPAAANRFFSALRAALRSALALALAVSLSSLSMVFLSWRWRSCSRRSDAEAGSTVVSRRVLVLLRCAGWSCSLSSQQLK